MDDVSAQIAVRRRWWSVADTTNWRPHPEALAIDWVTMVPNGARVGSEENVSKAETIDALVRAAERLLKVQHGSSVRLSEPVVIDRRDRSLTLRCAVSGWDTTASVVIKRNHGDDERGFSDWASLQFLTDVAGDVAPCFYAGDVRARFFVMEDLGASRSLEQIFSDGDESASVDALRSLAITMARLSSSRTGRSRATYHCGALSPEPRSLVASTRRIAGWKRSSASKHGPRRSTLKHLPPSKKRVKRSPASTPIPDRGWPSPMAIQPHPTTISPVTAPD